jgi:type VI secretion system protein ImpE
MRADELLQAGRLSDALAAATQAVREAPTDVAARALLFSLLCFEGNLERARKQLDVIDNQTTMTEAPTYVNLLLAEEQRRKVFAGLARPKFFGEPPHRIEQHLQAIEYLARNRYAEAHSLLDAAEEARPEFPGTLNDAPFDDMADADDITRSVLEFHFGPDYYWAPFDQIAHIQVVAPEPLRPQDLLWIPCQIILTDGSPRRGFTPMLYVNSDQAAEDSLKLGHETRFVDVGNNVFCGVGRKQFVAGDADPTPLELKEVTFDR